MSYKEYDGPDRISTAREFLVANQKRGGICPCCVRKYKEYKRFMTVGLVILLKEMAADGHIWQFLSRGSRSPLAFKGGKINGGYNDLWHPPWELITANPNEPLGWWQITERGRDFIAGSIAIPAWIATLKTATGVACVDFSKREIFEFEAKKPKKRKFKWQTTE